MKNIFLSIIGLICLSSNGLFAQNAATCNGKEYKLEDGKVFENSVHIGDAAVQIRCIENNVVIMGNDGNTWRYNGKVGDWTPSRHIDAGGSLKAGQILLSSNGKFCLLMQAQDGNLCVYHVNDDGTRGGFVWGTMKIDFPNPTLYMQEDGNLCIYDGKNVVKWASNTSPFTDAKYGTQEYKATRLILENDGKLVLYNSTGNKVWSN